MSDNNNAHRAGRIRTFYILISLLFLSPIIGAGSAWAHSTPKQQLSEDLLELLQVRTQVEQMLEEMKRTSQVQIQKMELDDSFQPIVDAYQAEVFKLLSTALSWEAQKQVFLAAYEATLGAQDMHDIIHFLKTEAGQRLISSQLEVQAMVRMQVNEKINSIQPQLQALNRELGEAMKKAVEARPPEG